MVVTDEMVDRACEAYDNWVGGGDRAYLSAMRAALTAALASMWRPVDGYFGQYEVSSAGIIRKVTGEIVGQWIKEGYLFARLTNPVTGERVMARAHRVVAEAFCKNPDGLPFVNHLDNNPLNNSASNLEWCTQEQNLAHMTRQGRRVNAHTGKRSHTATLTDAQANEVRTIYANGGGSQEALAKRYGMSKRCMGRLLRGLTYRTQEPHP